MEKLAYDINLDIATALSGNSKVWKNNKTTWSKLLEKLSKAIVTSETHKQFINASKDDQCKIKDVGGYVGGYLLNGRRKKESITHKQLISLDIDFSYSNFWWDFTIMYDCAACIHSTHKSTPDKPRHRLIIPLSREVTAEEYEPLARKIAGDMDIDLFDTSTFEINRLMYWPSVSNDIDYYFEYQDGPILDVDEVLNTYNDWKDVNEWPRAGKFDDALKLQIKKQEDPCEKSGIIGAFCRTYTIQEAIAEFLSDIYVECGENRYSYINGTTSGGLIVYDDKFAYSHHNTDPAGGRLCNAFDLVRIHKFGQFDNSNNKNEQSLKKMEQFASNDKNTKKVIANENFQSAKYDFGNAAPISEAQENDSWVEDMDVNTKGEYESTSNNINLILKHDAVIKNTFTLNKFDFRRYVKRDLPWRKLEIENMPEPIRDVDYSGLRNYIECIYGIASSLKIDDSLALEMERNSFHPIRNYLNSLVWDNKKRIDTLLIDYFGCDDNRYVRASMRKSLCAAVARVFMPGTKYDMVVILVGEQGTYKSTFIRKLGMQWFSDTFTTMQGKEAFEQLQGAWIIEMAELSALKKSESESIKQFISKCEDTYRPAYARTVETFKRQCIFFGTTNNADFLKDPTGNRRFNPIDIHPKRATKSVADDLNQYEIDQIWAEAYQLYLAGEKLYFDNEEANIAREEQRGHSALDERIGVIENFLNTLLPEDWNDKDVYERRSWLNDPLHKKGTVKRTIVCTGEIWCECLGKEKNDMSRYNTKDINDIMSNLHDWEYVSSTRQFNHYGKQRYFRRIQNNDDLL